MKTGQKITWKDLVSGRTRFGTLIEKNKVVSIAEANSELCPKDFKDVDYWSWNVREEKTKKVFCLKEDEFILVQPN